MIIAPDTTFIEKGSVLRTLSLLFGQDTAFIRKRNILAIRAVTTLIRKGNVVAVRPGYKPY